MTLRQEIEKIECSQCNNEPKGRDCPVRNSCLYGTSRVDRICEAIGKTANKSQQEKNTYLYWQKELGK